MYKVLTIVLLNVFSYLTIRLRPKLFKTELFKPMILNFKLSILPVFVLIGSFLTFLILRYTSTLTGWIFLNYLSYIIVILGGLSWLLLLPNSTYLITELNLTHRTQDKVEVPLWYDIVSILSFALSGLANTVLNINILQYIYLIVLDPKTIGRKDRVVYFLSAIILNLLMSIGIYLGRNIRFYSWDILKPKKFIRKLKDHFNTRDVIKEFFLYILIHTIFFTLIFGLFNTDSIFY